MFSSLPKLHVRTNDDDVTAVLVLLQEMPKQLLRQGSVRTVSPVEGLSLEPARILATADGLPFAAQKVETCESRPCGAATQPRAGGRDDEAESAVPWRSLSRGIECSFCALGGSLRLRRNDVRRCGISSSASLPATTRPKDRNRQVVSATCRGMPFGCAVTDGRIEPVLLRQTGPKPQPATTGADAPRHFPLGERFSGCRGQPSELRDRTAQCGGVAS